MTDSIIFDGCSSDNQSKLARVSIDKVVFTVSIPTGFEVRDFITRHIRSCMEFEKMNAVEIGDFKFYEQNFKFEDFYLSYGFKDRKRGDRDHLRIEFNPNKKCIKGLGFIFRCIPFDIYKVVKFNRLDFAIDYYGKLYPQFFYHRDKRKSTSIVYSGEYETLYLGSEMSDIQFRIYDKFKEILHRYGLKAEALDCVKCAEIMVNEHLDLNLNKDVWRFEVQLRKSGLSHAINANHNPCDGLECINGFKDLSGIDWQHRQFLHSVKNEGLQSTLKIMPRETRKRYISWLHKFGIPLQHPKDVWKEHFKNCFESLRSELKQIMIVPDIYEDEEVFV